MLPASICQWNVQYCFFLVSGLLGSDTEPSTMELAASSKHQCRNIDQERTAQWIITMSYSTALVTIKVYRLDKTLSKVVTELLGREETILILVWKLTNKNLDEQLTWCILVFPYSADLSVGAEPGAVSHGSISLQVLPGQPTGRRAAQPQTPPGLRFSPH